MLKGTRKQHTSENVKEADLNFFLLANIIADTASLELVANGNAINEMKKVGMLVAAEKLLTASTRGSANEAAITVPRSSRSAALIEVHRAFSTASPLSLCWLPRRSCSLFVSCQTMKKAHHEITAIDLKRESRLNDTVPRENCLLNFWPLAAISRLQQGTR